jgi:NADH-quinone oxidoreductase subunit E
MCQALTAEEELQFDHIRSRLSEFGKERSRIIPLLQMIQEELSYLPPAAITVVAEYLELSESEVYGVATFYNQFRFNPPGKHSIKVCMGTACHVRGGDIILENFERKLGIAENETTEDREYSLERVACVGCCALAPVALVGDTVHGGMAPSKVEGLITRIQVQNEIEEREQRQREDCEQSDT